MLAQYPVSGAGSLLARTAAAKEEAPLRSDGGSTQVGTMSQGKRTSQGKPSSNQETPVVKAEVPFGGYGNSLHLDDLQSFHQSLEGPLLAAYRSLELVDSDLCYYLRGVIGQVTDMVDSTAAVVSTHGSLSQQVLYEVIPNLKYTIATGDGHAQMSLLAGTKVMINRMKNDAKVVRASYLSILEAVQYLQSCTQLALDFYEFNDDASLLEGVAPNRLRSALQQLRQVQHILQDPSDFWLVFHVTELELGRIENSTVNFFRMSCPMMRTKTSMQIAQALELLALQYCPQGCPAL